MSIPIPFDTYEQRSIDNNVIKPKGMKIGFEESKARSITKNKSTPDEVQGSAAGKMHEQSGSLAQQESRLPYRTR